jgi:hypothetical protein
VTDIFNDRRPLPEPEPEPEKPPRRKPFRSTHELHPTGLDEKDPRVYAGEPIQPGTPVKHLGRIGTGPAAFDRVVDRDGNEQFVFNRQSLLPRQAKKKPPVEE